MTKRILILLTILLSTQLFGQDKTTYTLAEAEEFSITNSQKIKNVQLDLEISEKKIWETIAIGLPQVAAETNFQHFIDIPVSVVDATLFNPAAPAGSVMEFSMGQPYNATGTINVNQLLFDGSYIVGLQFSKFYKKMAQTNIDKTTVDVKMMVREAYYNVLVAKKNLTLMDSIQLSTKTLWTQTKVFYDNGFILKEDLDQLELAYNRISVNKTNAASQLNIAKNLLKLQMGYDLKNDIQLSENLDDLVNQISDSNPSLKPFSLDNNFDFIMVNQKLQLDEYALKNERAKYLPSVGAFLTHSQNAYRGEFDFFNGGGDGAWYPTTIWGIGVKVPILSSGQRYVKVQQAKIVLEQDKNTITDLENGLRFQELQLKMSYQSAYEMMELEEKNITLAKSIYMNSVNRKKEGAVNALNVTQMQNQLLQAEGSYINAVMQVLKYKIELDKLTNQ
jgi:outer membrane protein TolC